MINDKVRNINIDIMYSNFAKWHHDRNLVEGATDNAQFVKLVEEVIELYMCINPGHTPLEAKVTMENIIHDLWKRGRIKTEIDTSNLPDAVGDINVVLTNYSERHEFTMGQALYRAWQDIKDRKGRMIDGQFVKEQDL